MGLRTRMKSRFKRLFGRASPPTQAPDPTSRPSSDLPPTPSVQQGRPDPPAASVESTAQESTAQESTAQESTAQESTAQESTAQESTAPETVPPTSDSLREAKAAHHFEKTRRGVLRFIDEQGGEASLADMHDHSERRYFVGHKRFSDLMEGLVADSLISYDHGAGRAALTEAGRALGHTKMPPRPRA